MNFKTTRRITYRPECRETCKAVKLKIRGEKWCDNKEIGQNAPTSSKFFCSKCFTGLLIPLADNQRVHFEEEESNKLFRTKMFLLWFLQVLSNSV